MKTPKICAHTASAFGAALAMLLAACGGEPSAEVAAIPAEAPSAADGSQPISAFAESGASVGEPVSATPPSSARRNADDAARFKHRTQALTSIVQQGAAAVPQWVERSPINPAERGPYATKRFQYGPPEFQVGCPA